MKTKVGRTAIVLDDAVESEWDHSQPTQRDPGPRGNLMHRETFGMHRRVINSLDQAALTGPRDAIIEIKNPLCRYLPGRSSQPMQLNCSFLQKVSEAYGPTGGGPSLKEESFKEGSNPVLPDTLHAAAKNVVEPFEEPSCCEEEQEEQQKQQLAAWPAHQRCDEQAMIWQIMQEAMWECVSECVSNYSRPGRFH